MFWQDLATVGSLILLEGLLSADNALVLAVLVKHLPKKEQKKALKYGIIGALGFRFLCILLAVWLIHAWFFKALGAAYLFYIALKHLLTSDAHKESASYKKMGFWKTVVVVELTDIVFAIDSILAAVAFSRKIWVIYLGGILGMIAMRFVAGAFLKLIERFPGLETGAYVVVGWIGLKLALETAHEEIANFPHLMHPLLFWSMMGIIFGLSLFLGKKHKHPESPYGGN